MGAARKKWWVEAWIDMSDSEKMGEVICLNEWRERKDELERKQIDEDIKRMTLELKELMRDMDMETGPYIYERDWLECLPLLTRLDETLCGYTGFDSGSIDNR